MDMCSSRNDSPAREAALRILGDLYKPDQDDKSRHLRLHLALECNPEQVEARAQNQQLRSVRETCQEKLRKHEIDQFQFRECVREGRV